AGLGVEKAARWGACRLFVPAMYFAVLPAGHAWITGLRAACHRLGYRAGIVLAGVFVGGLLLAGQETVLNLGRRGGVTMPVTLGVSAAQQETVERLQSLTGPEARILWEDETETGRSFWTALLPLLTDRAFLGGLDAEAGIEHMYPSLVEQTLAGRHISTWTD